MNTPQLGASWRLLGIDVAEDDLQAEVRVTRRGPIAWLMRKLGMSWVSVLSIAPHGFRFEQVSVFNDTRRFYPASEVASTFFEYRRPRGLLMAALSLVLAAIVLLPIDQMPTSLVVVAVAFLLPLRGLDRAAVFALPLAASVYSFLERPTVMLGANGMLIVAGREAPIPSLACVGLALGCLLLYAVFYMLNRRQISLGLVSTAGSVNYIRVMADRFETYNLQRVLRVMEAILDRTPNADLEALFEVPLPARERLAQIQPAAPVQTESPPESFEPALPAPASGSVPLPPTVAPQQPASAAPPPEAPSGAAAQTAVYACPHCQARMRVPAALLGKVVRCPGCGGEARIG